MGRLRMGYEVVALEPHLETWFPGQTIGPVRHALVGLGIDDVEDQRYSRARLQTTGVTSLIDRGPVAELKMPTDQRMWEGKEFGLRVSDQCSYEWNQDDMSVHVGFEAQMSGMDGSSVQGGETTDVEAGSGDDRVRAGRGEGTVGGGRGADVLIGGRGFDFMAGGRGPDVLRGGPRLDDLGGNAGNDRLQGGRGDDSLEGGRGNDRIKGGRGGGDRIFLGFYRASIVDLAAGTATGQGSDTLSGVEGLVGSRYRDVLAGNRRANELFGFRGDDSLFGRGGDDLLDGEGGDDSAHGGRGEDACPNSEAVTRCES